MIHKWLVQFLYEFVSSVIVNLTFLSISWFRLGRLFALGKGGQWNLRPHAEGAADGQARMDLNPRYEIPSEG